MTTLPVAALDEARLRRLVDDLQVGVLIQGPRSEILYCNARAAELLGIPESALLGRTSMEADGFAVRRDGSPLPGSDHPGPRVLATGRPLRNVVIGWTASKDAPRVWLLVNADPETDAAGRVQRVVCTFTDITAQFTAEERLRESEARYRQLVETAQDILYRTDRMGFFTYVNPVTTRIMGWPADQILGRHFLELIREDHRARVEARLKQQYADRTH
ncbi:MAG TPA: PAS domain S-box protein, partial [Vicinamibacteria bacterium]|nr:PAS domain S-box protein [Vicinamibacteria bacterium]